MHIRALSIAQRVSLLHEGLSDSAGKEVQCLLIKRSKNPIVHMYYSSCASHNNKVLQVYAQTSCLQTDDTIMSSISNPFYCETYQTRHV